MVTPVPAQKEDRIVFASGSQEYAVRDIIDAAHFRGELERSWKEFLVRQKAELHAREIGAELDESALDEASVAFRYQYDLITAEETELWLDARGLTLGDFSEYFARGQWARTFRGMATAAQIPFVQASSEERELLAIELTLGGELDRLAVKLAWRVAARESGKAGELAAEAIEAERARFTERSGVAREAIPDWLSGLSRDENWLEENFALEAAYRVLCGKLLTKEALEREVSALRLPLTRIEMEMIELDSRDAANEAFLCVRDDGLSMEEVANEGRYPYRRAEMVLEEIPDDMQQRFLSLSPGSVLEPTPREDGFVLSRLLGKSEPRADDADVRKRTERVILERYFADLTSGRIKWRFLFTPADDE